MTSGASSAGAVGELCPVLLVAGRDAARTKAWLAARGRLSPRHRLCAAISRPGCVAVPLMGEAFDEDDLQQPDGSGGVDVLGTAVQVCPLRSTQFAHPSSTTAAVATADAHTSTHGRPAFNRVQEALFGVLRSMLPDRPLESSSSSAAAPTEEELATAIQHLGDPDCPARFHFLGDDRTLLLPPRALDPADPASRLRPLLAAVLGSADDGGDPAVGAAATAAMARVYERLARSCGSPRLVQRGRIDAGSGTRASGCRILWPSAGEGPGEWITVTEHGIRQSFNLTRTMFSRGNAAEKRRFGAELVRPGEAVLDLYAGIGYFALPALVLGRAGHLVACEWSPDAVEALRRNLCDNVVEDRATVYLGDCREVAMRYGLRDRFDRVSLGLLPSSQGGWQTAVRALKRETGGWLHVHGNVPVKERLVWFQWVCRSLLNFAEQDGLVDWAALGYHLQKVKSFAPNVNHYVADVWLGPAKLSQVSEIGIMGPGIAGVVLEGQAMVVNGGVEVPSCALSVDGVLHQTWMR